MAESQNQRALAIVLRVFGGLDALAILAVLMPTEWMGKAHACLGLGPLPREPIVGYLTRSASALYALHGAMILFISFDTRRYDRLITFLAAAALVHGTVMLGIDLAVGMPLLWTLGEGPAFAATGAIVLVIQRREKD